MSLQEQMLKAVSTVNKKFKEGDKVVMDSNMSSFLVGEQKPSLIYKIKSVNHLSYDLILDLSEEEISQAKKIAFECFCSGFDAYGNQIERLKENLPYSSEDLNKALQAESNLYHFNISENRLKFAK